MTFPQPSGDEQSGSTWSAQSGSPPSPDQSGRGAPSDPVTAGYSVAPGYHPPVSYPAAGHSDYATAPAYPPAAYPPPYGYPVAHRPTNGMAVSSMVVSIIAVGALGCYGLGGYLGIAGAIFGHVARRQIRQRGEDGDGMALAGVIMGWLATAIAVIATIAIISLVMFVVESSPSVPRSSTF